MAPHDHAPEWFRMAVANEATIHVLTADVRTSVRAWGDPMRPAIVLVHGGAAHASWWDPIAPLLARSHRVLAPDLTGHGESGARDSYSIATWADEVENLLASELLTGPPLLVGHSMGGQIVAEVALRRRARLGALVLLDAEFTPHGQEPTRPPDAVTRAGIRRFYPDRDSILSKFRLLPADTLIPDWMSHYVAERSIVAAAEGWTWKFDPRFFNHDFRHLDDLRPVACPVVVAPADRGLVSDDLAADTAERLGGGTTLTVRDSGHHALLEQPLQVAGLIEALAFQWLAPDGTKGHAGPPPSPPAAKTPIRPTVTRSHL